MNISKRNFLKAAPAALAAVPMAAKKLVGMIDGGATPGYASNSAKALGGSIYNGVSETVKGTIEGGFDPIEHVTWMVKHNKERRQRMLEGHNGSIEQNFVIAAERLDGLRSVSPVNRMRILNEHRDRINLRNELKWLDQEIAQLKKDHPLLAVVIDQLWSEK